MVEKLILFKPAYKKNDIKATLTRIALMLSLFVPIFAQAYTGITIVMSAPTQVNLEFVDQFKAELSKANHSNLRVNVITLPENEKLVVAENSELVIALGVKALEASSKLTHTTPVVGVFTPLPSFNSLLVKSRRDVTNFSAIILDQPFGRQISLIKEILPRANKLGVLLGSTSSQYGDYVRKEGEEKGFVVFEERAELEADLIPKLKSLLENTDVLMAIPDPVIYTRETAQPILLTSYRYRKPIFGYSQSYVRAGALAAVYSSSKQLAKQAAEIAIKAHPAPSELPPPQSPKYFSITLNYQVARSLNITLGDEDEIYNRMLVSDLKEGGR